MNKLQLASRGLVTAVFATTLAACSGDLSGPTATSDETTVASVNDAIPLAGSLRVRCERGSGRSKISVDGNNLTPGNGLLHARVRASGGTATSTSKRAVGDEVEFDFDSNPNDVAQGAERIPASFITARPGPDVIGEILNSSGGVISSQGAECSTR